MSPPLVDPFLIAMVILIGAFAASRFISESGLRHLSAEQKAIMVDAFSGLRKYSLILILLLIVATFGYPEVMLGLCVVYFLGVWFYTYRKIKTLDLPGPFTRAYLGSMAVKLAGLLGFIAVLFGSIFGLAVF